MRGKLNWTMAVVFLTAATAGRSAATGPGPLQGQNRYESPAQYGEPENYSLDDDPDNWPEDQSIRTVGFLQPGFGGAPGSPRTYGLEGESREYRLALTPVQEVANRLETDAQSWLGRQVEVVGVFPRRSAVDDRVDLSPRRTNRTLLMWSMLVLPERKKDELDAPRSSLEALVMDTEAAAGRLVTVTGNYRGGNLLEDLPNDSRRNKEDWVLSDGPFSIWVTGMKPEGKGFSLGLRSRSDLRWELALQGEVEVDDGFIYLRAERIRLVGPARNDPE